MSWKTATGCLSNHCLTVASGALASEWSKRERTRQLHIKRNNRLRGTVVSSVEFFGNTFYFWFLYNFFTQELPL